jgi:hypothetical protein
MMGIKGRAFDPLPPVTLEDLVPPDHFYRHLEDTLDLHFVRDLVRDVYAPSGRPSIDPIVFFKLQLVLFFEGLRSERQLMQVVADRFSLRWYLGYDLNEPLPDHSSLSRIRERYGLDVFRWHARFRWKVRPRQVTEDTKYGTIENIAAIEREHIRAYLPLSAVGQRAGMFGITDFVYDAGADTYRCPGHQRLRFISQCETTRRRIYAAPTGACAACMLRPQCTTSKRGRRVGRRVEETLSGSGAQLPRDRALRQGPAQTASLGGAAVHRSEGVARVAAIPAAGAGEGQQ